MYLYVYLMYMISICDVFCTYIRICTYMHVSIRPATFRTKYTCKYVYTYIYIQNTTDIRTIYITIYIQNTSVGI